MSPYRSAEPDTQSFDIGSAAELRMRIALGLVLLGITAGAILVAAKVGSGVAPLAVSTLLGAIFCARVRHCRIEVSRSAREVRVVISRVGPTVRGTLSFDEVESVHVAPSSLRVQKPSYVLQVGSAHGKAITLLKAETEAELRADRERVERFMVEAGVLPDRSAGR